MMSSLDETVSGILPDTSKKEQQKLKQTLNDISRNAMIRKEVLLKREEGKTVPEACREIAEKLNLEAEYVRKLYWQR